MKKLEIERRLLLKAMPTVQWDAVRLVYQYYKGQDRYRMVVEHGEAEYWITRKRRISAAVFEEFEKRISQANFLKQMEGCERFIFKHRYIKHTDYGTWEVDEFPFRLIIAEMEVETEEQLENIPIPDFIRSLVIADITGDSRFSNFSLAERADQHFRNQNLMLPLSMAIVKEDKKYIMSPKDRKIYVYVKSKPGCSSSDIAKHLEVPLPTIKKHLSGMVEREFLHQHGKGRGVNYTIK